MQLPEPGGPLAPRRRRRPSLVHDRDVVEVGGAQLAGVGLQRWISLGCPLHEPVDVATIGLPAGETDRTRFLLELPTQLRHGRAIARRVRQPLAPVPAPTGVPIDPGKHADEG
jgi:hypothetical protein